MYINCYQHESVENPSNAVNQVIEEIVLNKLVMIVLIFQD